MRSFYCAAGGGGLVIKLCPTLATRGLGTYQAALSMGFPGKNTGAGCHVLLQGILPTQESNPGLLHCRQILYPLNYQGSPFIVLRVTKISMSMVRKINSSS